MRQCPSCGIEITDLGAPTCPACGRALSTPERADLPVNPPVAPGQEIGVPLEPSPRDVGDDPAEVVPPAPDTFARPPVFTLGGPPGPPGYPAYPQGAALYSPYPPPVASPRRPPRSSNMLAAIVAGVLLICALATSGVVWLSNLRLTPPEAVATVTPQGTPTPTPIEVPVLNEDATSNWTGWSKSDHCFFRDGMYHVVGGYLYYSPADEATDAVISADIQQVTGETRWFYGIMFRATNQGTFDAFLVDSNGEWQFSKFADGKWTDIVPYSHTSAVHLGLGVTNSLKVRTVGSHFQFFINGAQVGEADDPGSSGRFCGIVGGNSTGGVEIGVSRFTVAWLR